MEGKQMETINISSFKATCLALLERVKKTGRPILVLKRGEPIAQILPPPTPENTGSWLGSFRNRARITGDIISSATEESDWETLSQ
jgi:antitoxin (DNA-binding transcriptional repressor) of toxin-antitoxin stability system